MKKQLLIIPLSLLFAACPATLKRVPDTADVSNHVGKIGTAATSAQQSAGKVGNQVHSARNDAERIDNKATVVLQYLK